MKSACTTNCETIFNSFDEDKDGKITQLQLQNCIALIGGGGLLADMVAHQDEPLVSGLQDGLVGLHEFAYLVESGSEDERVEDMRKAFGMYKTEGDECITPTSLRKMLGRLGDWSLDECVVMIDRFDCNGDGVLNFHEFQLMMDD